MKKLCMSLAVASMLVGGLGVTTSLEAAGKEFKLPKAPGVLGEVYVNPNGLAPLTAVIKRRGADISDIKVTVVGKPNGGVDVSYNVSNSAFLTNDGIPVWGLYPDYMNTVKVSFVKDGKKVNETYKIQGTGLDMINFANKGSLKGAKISATKMSSEFKDRLYVVMQRADGRQYLNWAQDGGAAGFDKPTDIYVFDTNGDVRWYLDTKQLYDLRGFDMTRRGSAMVSWQGKDGNIMMAQGQRYISFDMMGDVSYDRILPDGYQDAGHEIIEGKNGNVFLRVGKKDYLDPKNGNKYVGTIRDHIIEVSPSGKVVEEWDLNKILDNGRDVVLKASDPRAVCENVDANAKGQVQVSSDTPFGDMPGVRAGRNWAHINSVMYDHTDDSVVISVRHQATVKIGRDKQIKWILSPVAGWDKEYQKYLLKPVDKKGKKLDCDENGRCEGGFEYSYMQHTSYAVPELHKGSKQYLSIFDNGDARFNEQAVMDEDNYSRGVGYIVDTKNMTVTQDWQYGKERGFDWYSKITSNTNYVPEDNTWFMTSGNVYFLDRGKGAKPTVAYLSEVSVKDGKTKLEAEMKMEFDSKVGYLYRANIIHQDQLFNY